MKFLRYLLLVIAGVVVTVSLLLAVALIPAVQRWAVLRAAAQRGVTLAVERLAVRPGSLTVHHLSLAWPGLEVTMTDASFDFSLWDTVVHHRVLLRQADVAGLQIDLTGTAAVALIAGSTAATVPTTAPAVGPAARFSPGGAPPAFTGLLPQLRLPSGFVLGTCHIRAEVICHNATGQPPVHTWVQLTGGHLAPEQVAKFDFETLTKTPDARVPVGQVATRGTMSITLNQASAVERAEIHFLATAGGARLPAPTRLQADMELTHTSAGEAYALIVSSLESGTENRLLGLDIDHLAGSPKLTGAWQVQASKRQIDPFTLGLTLPEFSLTGAGRFELNPVTLAARVSGRLSGIIDRLQVLDARLQALGQVDASAAFDLECDQEHLQVNELTARISGRQPVIAIQAIQPFALDMETQRLTAAYPEKELLQIDLAGVPLSWIRPFIPGLKLDGDAVQGRLAMALHGEQLRVRTTAPFTIQGLAVKQGDRVLLPASNVSLQGSLDHTKNETQVTLEQLTIATAAGDHVQARGELGFKSGLSPSTTVQASFEALLPTLLDHYLPLGPAEARGALAFSRSGSSTQIDRLAAHITTPAGQVLLELTSPEAFRFDLADWSVETLSGRSGEILRLQFGRLPLAMFQRYLGDTRLTGDLLPGELSARVGSEGLQASMSAPLRLENLSLGRRGRPWIKDLVVECDPAVDFSAQGMRSTISARVDTAPGSTLFSVHTELNAEPSLFSAKIEGKTTFELALPALGTQPFLTGHATPTQGRISGESKFTYDRDLLAEGRLTLNGLMAAENNVPLPVVNLSFRAGLSEKGDVALRAPLLIDRLGERSDLTLAATLHPTGTGRLLEAKVTGEHFVVDDARALLNAFAPAKGPAKIGAARPVAGVESKSAAAEPTAVVEPPSLTAAPGVALSSPAAENTGAPWSGLTGQITLSLKSLVWGRQQEITGLTGKLAIEPQRLVLEQLAGNIGAEGRLDLKGEARFAAGASQAYTSAGDLSVTDLEVAPFFKVLAPDKPPTIEGRFNIRCHAEGTGRTLGELLAHTRGDFVLQSKKGIFRGLRRATAVSHTSGIVSGTARILGTLGVNPAKVENLAAGTDVASELAEELAAVQFDQLNVHLARDDAAHQVKLSEFTLVSPIIRLRGEGQIALAPGRSLLEQPLQLRMQMGVMGSLEARISKFKLPVLAKERDALGYRKLREAFTISGTLAKPDPDQLYSLLGRSLLDMLIP